MPYNFQFSLLREPENLFKKLLDIRENTAELLDHAHSKQK